MSASAGGLRLAAAGMARECGYRQANEDVVQFGAYGSAEPGARACTQAQAERAGWSML